MRGDAYEVSTESIPAEYQHRPHRQKASDPSSVGNCPALATPCPRRILLLQPGGR